MLCCDLFIKFKSEARLVVQEKLAVSKRVPAADQSIAPRHVEFTERFLDVEIRRTHVEMQTRRECNGADGTVRCYTNVANVGQCSNRLRRPESAAMCNVHLHHRNRAVLEQPV